MLTTTTTERIQRVREGLQAQAADWLLVPPSADFRWLTGTVVRSSERLLALAIPRTGDPFCIVPLLESEPIAQACPWLSLDVWADHEDPFARLEQRLGLERSPAVMIGEGLRVAPLLRLAERAKCRSAYPLLSPLRVCKEPEEIAAMERAAAHADRIAEEIGDAIRPGMTERTLARRAIDGFESLGDTDPWAIVASGPNAALPHHHTSDRAIQSGDVVIVDVGAYTDGYGSDITRTYWVDDPPADATEVYRVVDAAREAGIAAARPGARCESVDRAARDVIERAGFGKEFLHRTGHGVGLEVHEPPYLVGGNTETLRAGMTHSVEPGIYRSGRFGVRIEDLVVVEEGGARRLNRAPRDPRPPRLRA